MIESEEFILQICFSFAVRIIAFSTLHEFLSPEHDTTTMLKYMQQIAVLVQGNWVVNSELIYPKDSLSVQSNISELMCKARDYIVSVLSKNNRMLFMKCNFMFVQDILKNQMCLA